MLIGFEMLNFFSVETYIIVWHQGNKKKILLLVW